MHALQQQQSRPSLLRSSRCTHQQMPQALHSSLSAGGRQQRCSSTGLKRSATPGWRPAAAQARHRGVAVVRAAVPGDGSSADDILRKYGLPPVSSGGSSAAGGSSPLSNRSATPVVRSSPSPLANAAAAPPGNGVFLLLLANVVLFVLDHVLHRPGMSGLYLNHAHPQWYQWVTHAFCHANWEHLAANLFNLTVFGKMVEETEGAFGLIATYLITAVGAAAAAWALQPAVHHGAVSVSLGASGAIFGLFAVSVLTRLSWDPRRLLEGLVLGQFVVRQVLSEATAQAAGGLRVGGLAVGHIAHLGGALAGVLLVWALSKLPDPDASSK